MTSLQYSSHHHHHHNCEVEKSCKLDIVEIECAYRLFHDNCYVYKTTALGDIQYRD